MHRKLITRQLVFSILATFAVWFLNGCNGSQPPAKPTEKAPAPQAAGADHGDDDHGKEHGDDHGHHHHHAEKGPHGGTLVALGDEAAHLEFVLDKETGTLTAYILDGEAKDAVAIKQKEITLAFSLEEEAEGKEKSKDELPVMEELPLAAVSPSDSGEASEFAGQSDKLKGAEHFDAVLGSISVKGQEFKEAKFEFPEGNEHDHHH